MGNAVEELARAQCAWMAAMLLWSAASCTTSSSILSTAPRRVKARCCAGLNANTCMSSWATAPVSERGSLPAPALGTVVSFLGCFLLSPVLPLPLGVVLVVLVIGIVVVVVLFRVVGSFGVL